MEGRKRKGGRRKEEEENGGVVRQALSEVIKTGIYAMGDSVRRRKEGRRRKPCLRRRAAQSGRHGRQQTGTFLPLGTA